MDQYIALSTEADADGMVDFIANKTKKNYINLGGINNKEAIDCIHAFACQYGIWNRNDKVVHTKKLINYIPDTNQYSDISFIINFYNIARNAYQKIKNIPQNEQGETDIDNLDVKPQIINPVNDNNIGESYKDGENEIKSKQINNNNDEITIDKDNNNNINIIASESIIKSNSFIDGLKNLFDFNAGYNKLFSGCMVPNS